MYGMESYNKCKIQSKQNYGNIMFILVCLFSVIPVPCPDNCTCFHSFTYKANVTDCSRIKRKSLPKSVIDSTNWLLMSGNDLETLSAEPKYMATLDYVDFKGSNIQYLSDDFVELVLHSKSLTRIDLSQNKMTLLPESIKTLTNSTKIWLGGNPYNCECSILWIRDWLQKTSSVQDKDNVTCMNGKSLGVPIHMLDAKLMGCVWPYWVAIVAGSVSLLAIMVIITANHNWELIKFYCYMKFNILTNDDGPEDLTQMDFDAFISFRYSIRIFLN